MPAPASRKRIANFKTSADLDTKINRENREILAVGPEFFRELNRESDSEATRRKEIRRKNKILALRQFTRSFNKEVSDIQSIMEEDYEDEEGEDGGRRPSSTGVIQMRRLMIVPIPCHDKGPFEMLEDDTQAEDQQSGVSDSQSGSFKSLEHIGFGN